MIVSTKGRYALRVVIDLAMHSDGEYISLKEISNRSAISMKYLESIVSSLNKEGLLDSLRGKNGGY
ncbi:MAG: Rrf2 family transcriptional regulator, partial [Ruminococcus sp.]|nr:Rrf2 family transcriptional regulator [Ruminococcus sp.]